MRGAGIDDDVIQVTKASGPQEVPQYEMDASRQKEPVATERPSGILVN